MLYNPHAMDYGTGGKFVVWNSTGQVKLPKLKPQKGGSSQAQKFGRKLELILSEGDVVTESATVGSSGAERDMIAAITSESKNNLWLVSGRAVKNILGAGAEDLAAAECIYQIATEHPERLKLWRNHYPDARIRKFTSVRPYDKRDYKDEQVDRWLSVIPQPLPGELGKVFTSKTGELKKAAILPFAMAMFEPNVHDRNDYENVIGCYEHGYPSFYRRAFINLSNEIARDLAGVEHLSDLTHEQRKLGQKVCRKYIRQLYHLMQGTWNSAKGMSHPA